MNGSTDELAVLKWISEGNPNCQDEHAALLNAAPALAGQPEPAEEESESLALLKAVQALPLEFAGLSEKERERLLDPLRPNPKADEARDAFTNFSAKHAHPIYLQILHELYPLMEENNRRFFEGKLKPAHLTIGHVPPRSLGFCKILSDWGGKAQITLDRGLFWGKRRFITEGKGWPHPGFKRFTGDLLLHEQCHQYIQEVKKILKDGYRGHGHEFTALVNRIGKELGLDQVSMREHGKKNADLPLSNHWPMCVRPRDYYLGAVIWPPPSARKHQSNLRGVAGVMAYFRHLLDSGQTEELERVIRREAGRTEEPPCQAKPRQEKGEPIRLHPDYLDRNGGAARLILYAISAKSMSDLMPLLADALEAAGCGDELLLGHCRLPVTHTRDCWVVNSLLHA